MVSGTGMKCIKYLFIFCNGLLSAFGSAMFILALLIRYDKKTREFAGRKLGEYPDEMVGDMVVFIVLGFLMFFVGILAVIGATTEHLCILKIYVALIILTALFQLVYAVVVICMKEKIKKQVYKDIAVYVINLDLQSERMRFHFDHMQKFGNCCGCMGKHDYKKLRYWIPESCADSADIGCCPVIWNNMMTIGIAFGCVAVSIGIIEYITVVFTCVLISSIGKSRYRIKRSKKSDQSPLDDLWVKLQSYRKIDIY